MGDARRSESEPAGQGCEWRGKVWRARFLKPPYGVSAAAGLRVEFDSAVGREQRLKARDFRERQSYDREPIGKRVAGQPAEGQEVIQGGNEPRIVERAAKVAGKRIE